MVTVSALNKIYEEESRKRENKKGLSQYVDYFTNSKYDLDLDPWVEAGTPVLQPVPNAGHVKIIIFGAGLGGLCAAYRCLERGAASSIEDILIVDPAGGFGGTWWWNRFPGLMCDIESYVYLPLLEITGYMPKRKYSSGDEIRHYADLIADKFSLRQRAMFQTSGKRLTWSDEKGVWNCDLQLKPKGLHSQDVSITADYVIIASGTFTNPKLPALPGLNNFQGKMLHTGRWDYSITGGSSAEPNLTKLEGKKVALIGTGATAVQAVPHVARHAGELYVFQRTPSAVDVRDNRDTDPAEWSKIAYKKGWQAERAENFQAFTENVEKTPDVDLVYDGWTQMPTISATWGGNVAYKPEDLERFMGEMQEQDARRSDRVRQRVLDVVKDRDTAKKLQAWYPGWCKRPCFHDEYLPSFNRPNVHLIDTDAKGITDLSPSGIIANNTTYPVDIIIWSTGYGSPLTSSLAGKAEITVIGKNETDMDALFRQGDLATLHGVIARDFPNLFSLGLSQGGVGVNQTQRLDAQAEQAAYIIREAETHARNSGSHAHSRNGDKHESLKVVIEPHEDACGQWGDRIASYAYLLSNMGGCLPGYLNMEGDAGRAPAEVQAKSMRNTIYGQGLSVWLKIVGDWREKGDLEGLDVGIVKS